ncbi:MAG: glycoside hydrolase family 3 N-terminal domain-containing protein, partial [Lysobacterales bacterium]
MTVSNLRDPAIRQTADALLSRMDLDQKVGQMTLAERGSVTPADVRNYHIGAVLSGAGSAPGQNRTRDWVSMNDAYWVASMDPHHGGPAIPIMYATDAVHGHSNVGNATIFPHNIGLGASGDLDLIRRVAEITAREVMATGVDWVLGPPVSVVQDCRWGRTFESYSSDTATVAAYAAEFVKGIQSGQQGESLIACAKHWVGDGGTRHGIDQGDTRLEFADLERIHIAAYLPAIRDGVMTIMASFNSWNGDKCHGSKFLLTDVLKNRLQFNGFIVSDWEGTNYLSEDYHLAVAMAVNAGIDMFMVPENWPEFIRHLKRHVERGSVSMRRVDDAVRRILTVKLAA